MECIRKKRVERIQSGTVPFLTQLMDYINNKDDFNFNNLNIFSQGYLPEIKGSAIDIRNINKLIKEEKSRRIELGKVSLLQQLTDSIQRVDFSETVELLEQMTSDQVNEADPFLKNTPLHFACEINNSKAVAQLLKIDNIALDAKNKCD